MIGRACRPVGATRRSQKALQCLHGFLGRRFGQEAPAICDSLTTHVSGPRAPGLKRIAAALCNPTAAPQGENGTGDLFSSKVLFVVLEVDRPTRAVIFARRVYAGR